MMRFYHPAEPIRWSWVSLIGPDAQDFLHRLTTVDVRGLALGEGKPGFFLTAQGKIRSFFNLWNYRPGEYAFEFDAGADGKWKSELLSTIDQFTFAEKLTLADVTDLGTLWFFSDSGDEEKDDQKWRAMGLEPGHTLATAEEIRLCHHGRNDFGRSWVSAWGRPARLEAWRDREIEARETGFEEIESWRISNLRPRIGSELNEATIPLEAGLTDGIAQNKGCYPGQEVIERIIAHGAPARRLVLLEGKGKIPAPGTKVHNLADAPQEIGEITSATAHEGGFRAVGYLRKLNAKEGIQVQIQIQAQPEGKRSEPATVLRVAPYA